MVHDPNRCCKQKFDSRFRNEAEDASEAQIGDANGQLSRTDMPTPTNSAASRQWPMGLRTLKHDEAVHKTVRPL
jgi:hypothetical protein